MPPVTSTPSPLAQPRPSRAGAWIADSPFLIYLTPTIWGATFPAMKLALDALPIVSAMAWSRGLGALAVAATLPLLARGHLSRAALRRVAWPGLVLGTFIFLGYTLQTWGLDLTTATNAGFITGLYVVFTPVLALMLFREATGIWVWVAVAISVAGMALLSVPALDDLSLNAGDLLVLASAVAWAAHIVALSRYAPRYAALPLSFAQMAAAALLHLAVALFGPGLRGADAASIWHLLLITGVMGSGVAFTLQVLAQRKIDAARAVVILAGESLSAAVFAAFWLGERLLLHQWVGAALVLAAMTVSELGARRRAIHLEPSSAA
jgi:drug/metabolite transporter (DMT)-like permease